jgi:hypothetical protein
MASDREQLNRYYKENFGYDFGALPPERVDAALKVIKKLRTAQLPFYTQKDGTIGNPERAAIESVGGIDPKEAEAMSIFANWHAGRMPEPLDRDRLVKEGVPANEVDRMMGERSERWKQDARRDFEIFTRKEEKPVTEVKATKEGAEGEAKAAPETKAPAPAEDEGKERRAKGVYDKQNRRVTVVRY